jgi:hypothetical protein
MFISTVSRTLMTYRLQHWLVAAAAALCVAAPAAAQTASASAVTYNSSCGIAEQTIDDHGRTVIVTQCGGDLPGVLTLVLADPQSATLSGEWALNVSYTAPLHPGAPPVANSNDLDSGVGEQLIQKGVIHGTIVGGTAGMVGGQVSTLSSLQLAIGGGSVQFAGLTKSAGTGALSATNVDDRTASSTSLTLTF